jgi:hypothetical protein
MLLLLGEVMNSKLTLGLATASEPNSRQHTAPLFLNWFGQSEWDFIKLVPHDP